VLKLVIRRVTYITRSIVVVLKLKVVNSGTSVSDKVRIKIDKVFLQDNSVNEIRKVIIDTNIKIISWIINCRSFYINFIQIVEINSPIAFLKNKLKKKYSNKKYFYHSFRLLFQCENKGLHLLLLHSLQKRLQNH
jgi:hypothetical protein